ncbi:hypothetical protein C0991_007674, partial [Blastosporella zonata]
MEEPEISPVDEHGQSMHDTGIRSMDITDVHISPPHVNYESQSDGGEDRYDVQPSGEDEDPQTGSEQEHEPTFSSEGDPTPYPNNRFQSPRPAQYPGHVSSAFTSPSIAFTPTPAFPRPRARFDLPIAGDLLDTPQPPEQHDEQPRDDGPQEEDQDLEEPLTPSR